MITVDGLLGILLVAKKEHTAFEAANGPDADWVGWYAKFILKALGIKADVDEVAFELATTKATGAGWYNEAAYKLSWLFAEDAL